MWYIQGCQIRFLEVNPKKGLFKSLHKFFCFPHPTQATDWATPIPRETPEARQSLSMTLGVPSLEC